MRSDLKCYKNYKMTTSREKLICEALDAAIAQGIKIWPGTCFDWTDRPAGVIFKKFVVPNNSGALPSTCNAIGAMELLLGRTTKNPIGFTEKVCEYLKVGTYWLYRFHIGFDRNYQLVNKTEDKKKKGKTINKDDEVCKLGLKLRKRYIKTSCIQ